MRSAANCCGAWPDVPYATRSFIVGMTPFGVKVSLEVFPFVDGSRRILGSNYGFAEPVLDFPRYAQLAIDGRLPIERLIDRRIGLVDVEDAFERMRRGEDVRQVVVF